MYIQAYSISYLFIILLIFTIIIVYYDITVLWQKCPCFRDNEGILIWVQFFSSFIFISVFMHIYTQLCCAVDPESAQGVLLRFICICLNILDALCQSFLSTSTFLDAVEMHRGAAGRTTSVVWSGHDQLQQPWHGLDTMQTCSLK